MKTKVFIKKKYMSLIALLIVSVSLAQNGFNYKALITDNGNTIANQVISIKFTVLENGTTSVYQETQTGNTDANGIIAFSIGEGSVVSGDFSTIDWSSEDHFLKVEINTGSGYQDFGTTALKSVPYAKYADKSGNAFSGDFNDLSNVPTGLSDGDDINDADHDATNEIQTISKTGNTVTLSNGGGSFTDAVNDADHNATNEIQHLTLSGGNHLSISQGNSVTIPVGATQLNDLSDAFTGHFSVFLGNNSNTSGAYCVGVGRYALQNNTGSRSTALGYSALKTNTTGTNNTAIGYIALGDNTTGKYNNALGYSALSNNTTANDNTAIGYSTLRSNTIGERNTAVGSKALYNNVDGIHNTAVGYHTFYSGGSYDNSTALGYNASISASNQIRLGNNSVSSIGGYANWTNVSDRRFKKDIQENVVGLAFIKKLRPVTYHLDMDAIAKFNKMPDSLRLSESERLKAAELQTGFIAQEVEQAAQSVGYDFHGVDAPKNANDHYGLRYAEFVAPLTKAIQEQQAIIEQQQHEIDVLKQQRQQTNIKQQHEIDALKQQVQLLLQQR